MGFYRFTGCSSTLCGGCEWEWCQCPAPTVSLSPSFTPSTSAAPSTLPSVSPTISCFNPSLLFVLQLTTDDYGSETSWKLSNVMTNTTEGSGGDYSSAQSYKEMLCLDTNISYQFTIFDAYGDGLLDDGYYSIFLGNELLYTGKDFGSEESTLISTSTGPNKNSTRL